MLDVTTEGHVAEWLRNGLQNRVLRFNSGRGLQLSQSTYKNIASATRGRCTLVDLFGQGHWALDARQLHSRLFCAMQQSIGAMRQLSVIIMVYQRISACNERL